MNLTEPFKVLLEGRHVKNEDSLIYSLPIEIIENIWIEHVFWNASDDDLLDKVYLKLVKNWHLDPAKAHAKYREVFRQRILEEDGFACESNSDKVCMQLDRRETFFQRFIELDFDLDFFKHMCNMFDVDILECMVMMPFVVEYRKIEYMQYLHAKFPNLAYEMRADPNDMTITNISMFVLALSYDNVDMAEWIYAHTFNEDDRNLFLEQIEIATTNASYHSCDEIVSGKNLNLKVSTLEYALGKNGSFSVSAMALAVKHPFVNQKEILKWLAANIADQRTTGNHFNLLDSVPDIELMDWIRANLPPRFSQCTSARLCFECANAAIADAKRDEVENLLKETGSLIDRDVQKRVSELVRERDAADKVWKKHITIANWIESHYPSMHVTIFDIFHVFDARNVRLEIGFINYVINKFSELLQKKQPFDVSEIIHVVHALFIVAAHQKRCDILKWIHTMLPFTLIEHHLVKILRTTLVHGDINVALCIKDMIGVSARTVCHLLCSSESNLETAHINAFLSNFCNLTDSKEKFHDIFVEYCQRSVPSVLEKSVATFIVFLDTFYNKSLFTHDEVSKMIEMTLVNQDLFVHFTSLNTNT